MTASIVINADFKDGTPVAVVSPTTVTDRLLAFDKVSEMWAQVISKRRRLGKTVKSIAPPNWWFCSDERELAEVMEWLDSPALFPSKSVHDRTNFLTTTKKHIKQLAKGFGN